ncbi:MAG: sodium-dependent transporter [Alphaproteobacteria bacterium]|nr:sodium-dependent transporter [Alphaproteobacteria bacterium]
MPQQAENNEEWSSKAAFILAAVGSAVGLGNLWRFPYVAGENGGGVFVVFYVLCVLLIGLPVLVAELFIGRRGRMSAVGSVARIAKSEGRSTWWALQSWTGMIGAFVILTFYSVIAGWVIAYAVMIGSSLIGAIAADGPGAIAAGAFAGETGDAVKAKLGALLSDPVRMIFYHAVFMTITVAIVARGIKGGIEQAVTILMPAFFVMLAILVVFSVSTGDFARGGDFLFGFRLEDRVLENGEVVGGFLRGLRDGSVISAALGQAFFSIGLGSALMATYGAHMSRQQDLPRSARLVALSDTAVGILAGIAIFPIVFQVGLAPAAGPTLMFQTLPQAFQGMPFGAVFGLIFFVLAFFAAITSSIALLEASTAWFEEQQPGRQRTMIAIVLGGIAFLIGVANALSQVPAVNADGSVRDLFFNTWRPAEFIPLFEGMVLLDFLSATTDIVLPIAGFITAIFAGWVVSTSVSREEIGFESELWYQRWRFLIRWVCPIGIGAVIVYSTVIAPLLAAG